MNYRIIRTGSKGNALYVKIGGMNLLIDCGVPYKYVQGYVFDAVLLTHSHGDHFNPLTVSKIIRDQPKCYFIAPGSMMSDMLSLMGARSKTRLENVSFHTNEKIFFGKDLILTSFPLQHDIPNIGWFIQSDEESMLYATDTNSMDGLDFKNLDYYFIEANYDADEIMNKIAEKKGAGEFCYEERVIRTHMSRQQADQWLANNAGENSKFIYMHEHTDAHQEERREE